MVTWMVAFVAGAVNKPAELMDPALAPHETLVLKLPVPDTDALH